MRECYMLDIAQVIFRAVTNAPVVGHPGGKNNGRKYEWKPNNMYAFTLRTIENFQ
jgi:hypothetical protein